MRQRTLMLREYGYQSLVREKRRLLSPLLLVGSLVTRIGILQSSAIYSMASIMIPRKLATAYILSGASPSRRVMRNSTRRVSIFLMWDSTLTLETASSLRVLICRSNMYSGRSRGLIPIRWRVFQTLHTFIRLGAYNWIRFAPICLIANMGRNS